MSNINESFLFQCDIKWNFEIYAVKILKNLSSLANLIILKTIALVTNKFILFVHLIYI